MNLNKIKRIFMIGIGGAGMRALAILLKSRGIDVSGSDRDAENIQKNPAMQNFTVTSEDDGKELLSAADVVIYSDAVVETHPLRQYAAEHNLTAMPYQEALGHLASHYKVIAVTGTHGKSSTTALLSHILIENGLDPNVLVGAAIPAWNNQNAKVGQSDYLVLEADEYREHFLTLNTVHAIITTIDFDHPDYYKDLEHVKNAYNKFMARVSEDGIVAVPTNIQEEYPDMEWHKNTVAPSEELDLNEIDLALPGEHMRSNAALAITVAAKLGIDPLDAAKSLATFKGLSRRFEMLGQYAGMEIISDYGHHPEEIEATLKAGQERYPDKNMAVIVEIHMPDRLQTFYEGFVDALKHAKKVVFAPVFIPQGREDASIDTPKLLSELKQQLTETGVDVEEIIHYTDLEAKLTELSQNFDITMYFSAGVMDAKVRQILKGE